MTAQDQMRAMLDQLMGTSRNGEDDPHRVRFTDPKVCKSFLLSCCPHEILSSTRMDLGECARIHDFALRADYEIGSANKDYYYDIDAMEHLQSFISDCDRRTEAAKVRLVETQEVLSLEVAAKANKVHEFAEQIGQKLARAEQLGAEGLVEESMKLMEEIEDLRNRKAGAEQDYRNSMPASSYQQQKLRVCEVCSAYLGIHDNDRRLADHFGGKLHLGFITIREKLDDLTKLVESRKEKRKEVADCDAASRRDRGSRDRLYRGENRGGHQDVDRQRRRRSRSRGDRQRRRSRSRDRRHRSRSRDRDRDNRQSRGSDSSRRRRKSRSRDSSRSKEDKSGNTDEKRHSNSEAKLGMESNQSDEKQFAF